MHRTPRPDSSTLTERYVQAVTRTIPEAQRDDVAAELRASVADQLDARIESGEDAGPAERAVLSALGDPDKLAAEYVDRPLHLIGPRYYLEWWRLLKLLLWIVVPLAAFGIALGQTLAGEGIGTIVGSAIGGTLSVAVHLAFWTTLVFVIIERSERARDAVSSSLTRWSVDDLPEIQHTGASFADVVASIVFLVLAAAALIWDQLVGAVYLDGRWMSFLSPELWPWALGALLVIMGIEGSLQIVVYLQRRWTLPLAVMNAVLTVAVVVPAIVLLWQGMLLNPEFWLTVIPDDGEKVFGIISVITGFAIVGLGVWDIIDAFLKAQRARR